MFWIAGPAAVDGGHGWPSASSAAALLAERSRDRRPACGRDTDCALPGRLLPRQSRRGLGRAGRSCPPRSTSTAGSRARRR
jgi:hypothetical protein